MSLPTVDELLSACRAAEALGYRVLPHLTIMSQGDRRCCPLAAVALARGAHPYPSFGVYEVGEFLGVPATDVGGFIFAWEEGSADVPGGRGHDGARLGLAFRAVFPPAASG